MLKFPTNYLKFSRIPILLLLFFSLFNRVSAVSDPGISNLIINFTNSTISFNAYRSSPGGFVSIFQYVEITAKVDGKTIGTVAYSPVTWNGGNSYSPYNISRLSSDNYEVFGYASQTGGTWNKDNDVVTYTIEIGDTLLQRLQKASYPQLQLDFKMWWGDRDNKDLNKGISLSVGNNTIILVPHGSWKYSTQTKGYSIDDAYPKTPTIQSIQPVDSACYLYKAKVAKANGDNEEKGYIDLYNESGKEIGWCKWNGTEIFFKDS